jgi:hypothetical protein
MLSTVLRQCSEFASSDIHAHVAGFSDFHLITRRMDFHLLSLLILKTFSLLYRYSFKTTGTSSFNADLPKRCPRTRISQCWPVAHQSYSRLPMPRTGSNFVVVSQRGLFYSYCNRNPLILKDFCSEGTSHSPGRLSFARHNEELIN